MNSADISILFRYWKTFCIDIPAYMRYDIRVPPERRTKIYFSGGTGMFRKSIATAVASLMLLGFGGGSFAAQTESRYSEAIGAMRALEIMVGDAGSTDFRAGDPIKRSEFTKVAIHALGLADIASAYSRTSAFPDVEDTHWAKGYIAVAAKQGIVIGDTAGNFRPDDPVSYEEAITILVRMAGYEPAAQAGGGYPAGYLTVGQTGGVLDNVSATPGQPVNRGTVAQMTYNALGMKMMKQVGSGYSVTDKTLLQDRLHVAEIRGILEATSHMALSGTGAGEGRIRIDGTVYEADSMADSLVGQTVRALSRSTDGTDKVFFLTGDTVRTKTLTVQAEDIVSLTNTELVYENGAEQVRVGLASDVRFMLNGRPAEKAELPEMGTVTLISNSSKAYSVVSVTAYENMVVESVYAAAGKVTGTAGETLELDPENKNVYFTLTDREGNTLTAEALKQNDVLSIAKSEDGTVCRIWMHREAVSGTIEEISENRITVSEKTYTLSPDFSGTLRPGDRVTLRLDVTGKIAAADRLGMENAGYAYLLNAERGRGINGKLQLSVLDTAGQVQTLTCTDSIRLDDTSGISAETAEGTLSSFRGLITMTKNAEGLVTEISRAADETASFPQSHEARFVLNTVLSDSVFSSTSMKLGSVRIDKNTVFFNVPDGETDSTRYTAGNYTLLTDKTAYNAYVYDMKEDMTAGAVILTGAIGTVRAEAPILVVSRVTGAQNEEGEAVDKLYGLSEKGEVALLAADGVSLSELAEGDVVQYSIDASGKVAEVRILLAAADRETEGKVALSDTVETVYGKVTARFASSVNVTVDGAGAENYAIDSAKVYLFDSERSAGRVQTATAADIGKYADDGSRIFLRLENGIAKEIVIIR